MLVLSRHKDESIVINDDITITIVGINGDKVRVGIVAPKDVPVHRLEVYNAIHRERSQVAEDVSKSVMTEGNIDISGLDKAEVLAALFNASKQQGMGFFDSSGGNSMTVEDARQYTSREGDQYYDYLRGRVMKIDLSSDELNPRLYDRDNGQGAAASALAALLESRISLDTTETKE